MMLERIEDNGVRTVIVEDVSRFARELMTQELGVALLIARRVRLLMASGNDLTNSDDPSRKMMRQIAGAFAEYEKARLVGKLRSARQRARHERGRCEGRKTLAEKHPEAVALAKRLHRASAKTGERRSLRSHLGRTGEGRVFEHAVVKHPAVQAVLAAFPVRRSRLFGRERTAKP